MNPLRTLFMYGGLPADVGVPPEEHHGCCMWSGGGVLQAAVSAKDHIFGLDAGNGIPQSTEPAGGLPI